VIKSIAAVELQQRLNTAKAPLVLEALPERYWRDRHLPGARLFPHDQATQLAPTMVPARDTAIVLYCASATCQNSHIAAQLLERAGYTDVTVFGGGKEAWEAAGFPFETDAATA